MYYVYSIIFPAKNQPRHAKNQPLSAGVYPFLPFVVCSCQRAHDLAHLVSLADWSSPRPSPRPPYTSMSSGERAGRRDLLRIALTASRFGESFGVKPQVSHTIALGPPVSAVHLAALANEVFETWSSPSLSPSLHQSQIAPPRRTPFTFSPVTRVSREGRVFHRGWARTAERSETAEGRGGWEVGPGT